MRRWYSRRCHRWIDEIVVIDIEAPDRRSRRSASTCYEALLAAGDPDFRLAGHYGRMAVALPALYFRDHGRSERRRL